MTAEDLNRIFIVNFSLSTSLVQLASVQIASSPALGQAAYTQHLVHSSQNPCKVNVSIFKRSVEFLLCAGQHSGPCR